MGKRKLTDDERAAVERWLVSKDREDECPFSDFNNESGENIYQDIDRKWCYEICGAWFPRVNNWIDETYGAPLLWCPCHNYSMKTVAKRAREMLDY